MLDLVLELLELPLEVVDSEVFIVPFLLGLGLEIGHHVFARFSNGLLSTVSVQQLLQSDFFGLAGVGKQVFAPCRLSTHCYSLF